MSGLTSLTGGGGLSAGGGGPSNALNQTSAGYDSSFVVNFGQRGAATWLPWVAVAAVVGLYLWRRR